MGFTIIELIVVMTIIGILAAFAIPEYMNYVDVARLISSVSVLETMRTDMEYYRNQHEAYPASIDFSNFTDQDGKPFLNSGTQQDLHGAIFSWDGYARDDSGYTITARAINRKHTVLTLTLIGVRY